MENPLKKHIQQIRQLGIDARRSTSPPSTEREQRVLIVVAIVFIGLTVLHYVEKRRDRAQAMTAENRSSSESATLASQAAGHLYLQGAGSLPGLDLDLLRAAKRSIDFMSAGTLGESVCAGLIGASARGLAVRVYFDSVKQKSGKNVAQPCVTELRQQGAEVRVASAEHEIHYRAYLVDGSVLRFGLAGNNENSSLQDEPTVVTIGLLSANRDFAGEFNRLWFQSGNKQLDGAAPSKLR